VNEQVPERVPVIRPWEWKTWRRLAVVTVGVVLLLAWLLALRPGSPAIGPASLDAIRPGMDRAEVVQLLGGPPGDYRRRTTTVYKATAVVVPNGMPCDDEDLSLEFPDQWQGEAMLIVVRFDEEGKVRSAYGVLPSPPLWYRTVRRWLTLPG
jgi:hypothetical protein